MKIILIVAAATVLLAGCATIVADDSAEIATTHESFTEHLGLNKVYLPEQSKLRSAKVDGMQAFCSVKPAFFELGGSRGVCFFDTENSGYFNKLYVLGTLRSLTYDAHIAYSLANRFAAPTAAERAEAADLAQCQYETHGSANVGYQPTLAGLLVANLAAGVEANNVMRLCMNARSAARQ